MYVPPIIIEELNSIMREKDITQKAEAFKKMNEYARLGRYVKESESFNNITPMIPIDRLNSIKIKPKKQKRVRESTYLDMFDYSNIV